MEVAGGGRREPSAGSLAPLRPPIAPTRGPARHPEVWPAVMRPLPAKIIRGVWLRAAAEGAVLGYTSICVTVFFLMVSVI